MIMHAAELYRQMPGKAVSCNLCQRRCYIKNGERGFCRVRENRDGKLFSLNYGKCVSYCNDPIEKKPFYHFMPGSQVFSFAAAGCNFRCEHCFTEGTFVCIKNGVIVFNELFENGVPERKAFDGTELMVPGHQRAYGASGKLQKIVRVSRHYYDGPTLVIKAAYLPPVECTPDHDLLVFKGGHLQKIAACGVRKGDILVVPKLKRARTSKSIKLSEILGRIKASAKKSGKKTALKNMGEIVKMKMTGATSRQIAARFSLHPAYVRTFLSKYRKHGESIACNQEISLKKKDGKVRFNYGKGCELADEIQITEDLAALLGFFCAEGSFSKCPERPNSYSMRFCLGKTETGLAAEIMDRFSRVFKTKLVMENCRTTLVLRCSSSILALFFGVACGRSAYEKKVPGFIFDSDDSIIREFLIAYNKGDGWNKKGNHPLSVDTVSKRLAIGVFSLFLRLEILPFYHEYTPPENTVIERRKVRQSTLYYVKLYSEEMRARFEKRKPAGIRRRNYGENDSFFFVPVKKITERNYSGYVYNMEVEGEHSYLANFVGVANCQNWEISQPKGIFGQEIPPQGLVDLAIAHKSVGIAYTYIEPTIFYEYAKDTALLAREKGLYNVFVTNGYQTPETIGTLSWLDSARIDLKAFDDKFYTKICGGAHLEPVLKSIKLLHSKMHVEIITLLIPTLNDSDEEIRALSKWVKELDADIPLHFTGYYPSNRMTIPSTPAETLLRARKIAMGEGLKYVYTGNRPGDEGESTYCPACGCCVIKRFGFKVLENRLLGGKCPGCRASLPIITNWKKGRKS